jgi:succinate dehydrogenase / fumarate reductase flavoprotein subunit
LRNLLVTSEAVARAAIMREESRGAHSRIDFESESDEWLQYNIILKKSSSGTMSAEKRLRDKPDPELERIAKLSIEELEAEVIHDKSQG